jgi:hypothetical protein
MPNTVHREPLASNESIARGEPGFASRKRLQALADRVWRQTVTHYTPEPWLVAQGRDRSGLPVRPGHRPGANR